MRCCGHHSHTRCGLLGGFFLGAPADRPEAADVASELNAIGIFLYEEVSCSPPSSLLIPCTGEKEEGGTIKRSERLLCPPSLSGLWCGASPLQTFCRCLPTEN